MSNSTVLYPTLPKSDQIDTAKHHLKMMIFGVDTRPDGFDSDGILWLVKNWLLLGRYLRGPEYGRGVMFMFRRRLQARPTPKGLKRTQHLVASLKQLNHFLHPGERNLEGLYQLFSDVELQMFELVSEFRRIMEEMKHKDLAKFNSGLEQTLHHVAIKYYN